MAGDTLDVYWGELFVNPVPLELSLNYCSHKCLYCFANLNKPDRTADVAATMRLLSNYRTRKSLAAKFLQMGYPVLISNRVDPFANSNYKQALPIMRTMAEIGVPIEIQTRGGRGIDEALEFMQPSVWDISIPYLDDDLRSQIEPGAPTIDSRFELCETLRAKGHQPVVGLMPYFHEWQPDIEPMLKRLRDAGVENIWFEKLHFNHRQIARMKDWERERIGDKALAAGKNRKPDSENSIAFYAARQIAIDEGFNVYTENQHERSDFFAPWRECYEHTFPIQQDFINFCHDIGLGPGDLISFDLYADFMTAQLPAGVLGIGHYLGATMHNLWWEFQLRDGNNMTFRQLLGILWKESRARFSPLGSSAFAYAGEYDDTEPAGWVQYVDDNGMPWLTFHPDGTTEYYCNVSDYADMAEMPEVI